MTAGDRGSMVAADTPNPAGKVQGSHSVAAGLLSSKAGVFQSAGGSLRVSR